MVTRRNMVLCSTATTQYSTSSLHRWEQWFQKLSDWRISKLIESICATYFVLFYFFALTIIFKISPNDYCNVTWVIMRAAYRTSRGHWGAWTVWGGGGGVSFCTSPLHINCYFDFCQLCATQLTKVKIAISVQGRRTEARGGACISPPDPAPSIPENVPISPITPIFSPLPTSRLSYPRHRESFYNLPDIFVLL